LLQSCSGLRQLDLLDGAILDADTAAILSTVCMVRLLFSMLLLLLCCSLFRASTAYFLGPECSIPK
jgi:hypothetical protein